MRLILIIYLFNPTYQKSFQPVISIHIFLVRLDILGEYLVTGVHFSLNSLSQFTLVTFQVFKSHMWLVIITALDSTGLGEKVDIS